MVTRVTRPGDADWRSRRFERNRPLRTTRSPIVIHSLNPAARPPRRRRLRPSDCAVAKAARDTPNQPGTARQGSKRHLRRPGNGREQVHRGGQRPANPTRHSRPQAQQRTMAGPDRPAPHPPARAPRFLSWIPTSINQPHPAQAGLQICHASQDVEARHPLFPRVTSTPPTCRPDMKHMLTFINLAYSMMALLHETVPAFEDRWIECLGDLGRYRMAIEDDDIRDRKVWTAVCRGWYGKASDMAPTIGRLYHHLLYHHLAILALPDPLQQLYCYPNRVEPCLAYSELLLTTPILPEEDYAMGSFAWTERYLAESSVFDANCDETVFSLVVPVRIGAPMHCFSKRVVHRSGFGSLARILRSSAFHKLIRAWIPFALLSLAHARLDPWRTHKVIGMGVSAVSTLGTSLASMQVDHVAGEEGKMAKMTLRIICSVSLMILAGGYITCFLHNGRKARPFLKGFFSVALACVIFVGLFLGSSTAAPTDEFAILDRINVTGLMSVLAGIFNAESRLFESFCGEQGSANDGDHDDDGDDNDVAFQESRIGLTRSTSSFGRTQSGIHRESYASPYQNQPGSSFSAGGL